MRGSDHIAYDRQSRLPVFLLKALLFLPQEEVIPTEGPGSNGSEAQESAGQSSGMEDDGSGGGGDVGSESDALGHVEKRVEMAGRRRLCKAAD